jgi:hypothetical protein
MKTIVLVAASLLGVPPEMAQDPAPSAPAGSLSLFPDGYPSHGALGAALKRLAAEHPKTLRVRSLARTAEGRDVWLATLGRDRPASEPARPALLIVANLEADHLVGSQVALGLIERLAAADGADADVTRLLDDHTIYIVPRLNPDGAERSFSSPRIDLRTNLHPVDRDRDGRPGEDGPDDLDGDGVATRMRLRDAAKAALVADEKDPRLLRRADRTKGERAVVSETSEGSDDDGDGLIDEDPPGGVNLNRNWPHRWTEFDPEAGFSPASEPEVRALIQFAFDHPEIAIVWTFGLNDNLRSEPRKPDSALDDADLPYFAEFSRRYNRALARPASDPPKDEPRPAATDGAAERPPAAAPAEERASRGAPPRGPAGRGERRPPRGMAGGASLPVPFSAASAASGSALGLGGTTDGAMSEWAYHQFGAVGLASRLWSSPTIPDPPPDRPKPPADGEARWLYWNDHVLGGRAFVPFAKFDHPTLGAVEIGGWKPGVRLNPPIEQVEAITSGHLTFLKDLGRQFAALAVPEVKVEAQGGGLFRVSAVVENTGYLPTALAQGVRTRQADPVLVRLKADGAKILAGRALNRIETLAGSGGRQEFRWLVLVPDTIKTIILEVATHKAGRVVKVIELKR